MSTAFGEVYQYTVSAPTMSLIAGSRTLHDWVIRYALLTIPGVSEINSWGGETKQYTAEVEPGKPSVAFNLTLHDVSHRRDKQQRQISAAAILSTRSSSTRCAAWAARRTSTTWAISSSPPPTAIPVLLKQVATIETAALPRHGAVMRNGQGETVSGMVIILRGENGQEDHQANQGKDRRPEAAEWREDHSFLRPVRCNQRDDCDGSPQLDRKPPCLLS